MSRNLRCVKAAVIGAPSRLDAAEYVEAKLSQAGMLIVDDFKKATFFWIVLPDQGVRRTLGDVAFTTTAAGKILQFDSISNGVVVVSGDGGPLRAFTPFALGARGIMSQVTDDLVIRVVIERGYSLAKCTIDVTSTSAK